MNNKKLRARIKEHWQSFDSFAESQNGVNGAIIRALDVFQGALENFTAASSTQDKNHFEPQADAPVGHQFSTSLLFPKGDANTSDDRSRTAYFRAEESLALAREQLARSERTLGLMAEEVEGARQCIGSSYSMEKVRDREEREAKLAQASRQALDRGEVGCLMSPVDMVRAMGALLSMHQSELEMQETIIDDIGYTTPGEVFTAYREALSLRPFMDDRFLSQVQEIRELSAELERSTPHPATGISSRT